jgi:broad specificity phosphatase PhoE
MMTQIAPFRHVIHLLGLLTNLHRVCLISFPGTEAYAPRNFATRGKPQSTLLGQTRDKNVEDNVNSKRIVFIRHGRTYMNDLINGIHYGRPGFTDIFPDTPEYNDKYNDSPLAPTGLGQVKALNEMLRDLVDKKPGAREALGLSQDEAALLDELDLVVTSPLTRALQTMEMGLYPHIQTREVPVVAVPQAAERVYMVSDLGKTRAELKGQYSYVDFDTGFGEDHADDDPWHFIPSEEDTETYVEWRPHGEGQVYACLGEPQHYFDKRMSELYHWLGSREESTIAVVCHAGVIQSMVDEIFENCELRIVPFESLQPKALQQLDQYERIRNSTIG